MIVIKSFSKDILFKSKKNKAKLNWIRLSEKGRILIGCKYSNPIVTFDGINFWISVGIE